MIRPSLIHRHMSWKNTRTPSSLGVLSLGLLDFFLLSDEEEEGGEKPYGYSHKFHQ